MDIRRLVRTCCNALMGQGVVGQDKATINLGEQTNTILNFL